MGRAATAIGARADVSEASARASLAAVNKRVGTRWPAGKGERRVTAAEPPV